MLYAFSTNFLVSNNYNKCVNMVLYSVLYSINRRKSDEGITSKLSSILIMPRAHPYYSVEGGGVWWWNRVRLYFFI